jgi:hypothetical protein
MTTRPDDEFKTRLADCFSGLLMAAQLYDTADRKHDQDSLRLHEASMKEHALEYAKLVGQAESAGWMPALPLYKDRRALMVDLGETALQAQARIDWMCEWRAP